MNLDSTLKLRLVLTVFRDGGLWRCTRQVSAYVRKFRDFSYQMRPMSTWVLPKVIQSGGTEALIDKHVASSRQDEASSNQSSQCTWQMGKQLKTGRLFSHGKSNIQSQINSIDLNRSMKFPVEESDRRRDLTRVVWVVSHVLC